MLVDVHMHDGCVDDLIRILSFHPAFLREFMSFYNYLMYSQGALSYDARHYIAIMAASRHNSIYLVKQQENEFTLQNGQHAWLLGLEHVPAKLTALNELNRLLCHQPWLIDHTHIERLLKGGSQCSWSVTELIMAVTILTHFHALAGFVFGCGINHNYMHKLAVDYEQEHASALTTTTTASTNNNNNNGRQRLATNGSSKSHGVRAASVSQQQYGNEQNVAFASCGGCGGGATFGEYLDLDELGGADEADDVNEEDTHSIHVCKSTMTKKKNTQTQQDNKERSNRSRSNGTINRTLSNSVIHLALHSQIYTVKPLFVRNVLTSLPLL